MKKRFLTGIITAGLVLSMATPAFATDVILIPSNQTSAVETQTSLVTSFSDVPSSHWAYNDIMTIVNKGAISGTTTPVNGVGTYNPDGKVTLSQFLAISTRLVVPDILAKSEATSNHWASKNRNAAVESGFINRYAFLEEDLDAAISREDMAYILVNIAKANGKDLKKIEGIHNNISDYMIIAPIKRSAVLQAYSIGDIVKLKLSDIVFESGRYHLNIIEEKTKKKRTFTVPNEVYTYLQGYVVPPFAMP